MISDGYHQSRSDSLQVPQSLKTMNNLQTEDTSPENSDCYASSGDH